MGEHTVKPLPKSTENTVGVKIKLEANLAISHIEEKTNKA